MVDILNFLTFTWLTIWFVFSIVKLVKRTFYSILFAIIVLYVFFAIPIALDLFIGKPFYRYYPGFELSKNDDLVSIIYCFYISFIPIIWWLTGKPKKYSRDLIKKVDYQLFKPFRPLFVILLISPLIALIFAPNPLFYTHYGAILVGEFISEEIRSYHSIISLITFISVVSGCALLLLRDKLKLSNVLIILPWLIFSVWLNGKRAIVAVVVLMLGYALWHNGLLKSWRLLVSIMIAVIFIVGYSSLYQQNLRYDNGPSLSFKQKYENIRVDYGRDDVTKMTIYSEIHPDRMEILEYRGQSILYNLLMYIPRKWWPEKPWPYAVYFTSAMLSMPPQYIGWGMTTSWLEEAIANFSWFGFLIGPLFISLLCRIGDSTRDPIISALTVLVVTLFLVVQLAAFAPLFILWILLIFWSSIKNRRKNKSKFNAHHPVS
ncbi:hypothetical protein [Falsibacillus pallidus]|uniref:Oligosaccharide repeat unit polymerase n=1 Tax=Falsibacillus pallidus TaxID=493781 RepID=A0A370GEX8_9BACI|nr:hypothetical protein [Falsibacillus pallidus]RDI41659.1 hypothetical protein DFR59_107114 [Falsibacillus pallidus]